MVDNRISLFIVFSDAGSEKFNKLGSQHEYNEHSLI